MKPRASLMTVLELTASSRIGGVETYLLRLATHIQQGDNRVIFVTRSGVPLQSELEKRGIRVDPFFRGGKNFLTLFRLVRLIRRERVDLVHTHIFSANSLGAMAAKITGVPSVARVPATEGIKHYGRSTYVTAVSHNVASHLVDQGFDPKQIRVFYNGVDWKHFETLPSKATTRSAFGLPLEAFVILCAASFTSRKGQRFLLEAASRLPANIHVLFCGEGKEEDALRELAARLNMGNRVHFAGFLADVRPALAASDVFVLPSLQEGLPNSIMEALAAGLPSIGTNIAGVPEIIEPEMTGLLVPPGEVDPLYDALERLYSDADLRERLSANGRELVRERFDSDICLRQIETFFEQIATAWRDGKKLVPTPESSS